MAVEIGVCDSHDAFSIQVAQRDTPELPGVSHTESRWRVSSSNVVPAPSRSGFVRRPTSPAPVDSPLLSKFIKDCRTWQELAAVVHRHSSGFNFLHAAAAMTHLAQLRSSALDEAEARGQHSTGMLSGEAPEPALALSWPTEEGMAGNPELVALMEELLVSAEVHMRQFGARQATNVLWSLAHLHALHPSGCAWLAAELLPLMRSLLPWCEPQHLSNSIWAVARLEEACPELRPDDAWLEEFLVCSERALPVSSNQRLWFIPRVTVWKGWNVGGYR